MSLFTVLFALVLNFIYYFVSQKLRVSQFIKYFAGFVAYTLIIFFIFFLLDLNFIFNEFIAFLFVYTLFFISLFLTMSAKHIKSPTYLIFKILKNQRTKSEIIKYIENQNVLKKRLNDLINQKIVKIKKNKIFLKKNLNFVFYLILKIKNFFKLKSEG